MPILPGYRIGCACVSPEHRPDCLLSHCLTKAVATDILLMLLKAITPHLETILEASTRGAPRSGGLAQHAPSTSDGLKRFCQSVCVHSGSNRAFSSDVCARGPDTADAGDPSIGALLARSNEYFSSIWA